MNKIFTYSLKELFKVPIAIFFCFVPAIIFLVLMIIFKSKINNNNADNINLIIISFEIFYIAALTLNGLSHQHFIKKTSYELKNIALANISPLKYIIAMSMVYYFLFMIMFVIINIIFIILYNLIFLQILYYLLASVVIFILLFSITFLITSCVKNYKSLTSITFIIFAVVGCIAVVPLLNHNQVFNTVLKTLPLSSTFYFFKDLLNASFNILAFVFMIGYLALFFTLSWKYYRWI